MSSKPDELLSASDRLIHELTVAADASIGVVAIRCAETEVYRVVDDLYTLAMNISTGFKLHTAETGWCEYHRIDPEDTKAPAFDPLQPQTNDKNSAAVEGAFSHLWDEQATSGFFVMLDIHYSFDAMAVQTRLRKQVQRSLSTDQQLFLIVPNYADIPDTIAPLLHVIEFGYPMHNELSQSLDDILDNLKPEDRPGSTVETTTKKGKSTTIAALTEQERNTIISNGQGMTASGFETAVALSVTEYGAEHGSMKGFNASYVTKVIRNYKTLLLRKTNVLELQTPVPETDIGGLDLFKAWMHQRKETFTPVAKKLGVTPSRGALVIGPPGTGKSMVAKAAGSILNLVVIRFDVGRVFGSYIGQSEQSMRTVLSMLDAMAPCVLMLDEIDKGFSGMSGGGGGNDSGTTARVFGTFLTWMQERDQINRPVFLIMTANRIDGLPPELLRKGRIDEIWSVNLPNAVEREQIIEIHLRMRGQQLDKGEIKSITRITEQLVGAEIEALIEDALVISLGRKNHGVTYELVGEAKKYLKPMSTTREAEFKAMQQWAADNARSASVEITKPQGSAQNSKRGLRRRRPKSRS